MPRPPEVSFHFDAYTDYSYTDKTGNVHSLKPEEYCFRIRQSMESASVIYVTLRKSGFWQVFFSYDTVYVESFQLEVGKIEAQLNEAKLKLIERRDDANAIDSELKAVYAKRHN